MCACIRLQRGDPPEPAAVGRRAQFRAADRFEALVQRARPEFGARSSIVCLESPMNGVSLSGFRKSGSIRKRTARGEFVFSQAAERLG
jgi:hypothetical protein